MTCRYLRIEFVIASLRDALVSERPLVSQGELQELLTYSTDDITKVNPGGSSNPKAVRQFLLLFLTGIPGPASA